jgi:uncharacterized membrane protein YcaP (DUF421 family)
VKGRYKVIVKDGKIDWDTMKDSYIGVRNLLNAVRSNIHSSSLECVEEVRLRETDA